MYPAGDMVRAFAGRHAMVSFEHPEQIAVAAEICQSVVLDNGAFSAWRAGRPHDFAGYMDWCRHWLRHPAVEWAAIPDVINGSEEENDELLKSWPLPPAVSVPVYHLDECPSRLARLVERYPRVAIGSSGRYSDPGDRNWWHRMTEVMAQACDADGFPKTKLHGMRMLDPGIFSKLPLASADSTNVARSVGQDGKWSGSYVPQSRALRAQILMERIERHASARLWNPEVIGAYQNMDLFG